MVSFAGTFATGTPIVSLAFGSTSTTIAANASAGIRGAAAVDVIRLTTQRLFAEIETQRDSLTDPGARRSLVERHIAEHIDFRRISMRVLGKHWRRASPELRTQFRYELRRMVFRAFADLLVADQASIDFGPSRVKSGSGRASVRSTFRTREHRGLDLRFRLLKSPQGWKLYDVVVEGVSLVATYRTVFDAEIRSKGLSMVVKSLSAKNDTIDNSDS